MSEGSCADDQSPTKNLNHRKRSNKLSNTGTKLVFPKFKNQKKQKKVMGDVDITYFPTLKFFKSIDNGVRAYVNTTNNTDASFTGISQTLN